MDAVGTSDDNTNFTYYDDLMNSDLNVSYNDDGEPNLDPVIREELEILLLRMFDLVQECYYHLIFNASINKVHVNSSKDFNVDRPYEGILGTYQCQPNYML